MVEETDLKSASPNGFGGSIPSPSAAFWNGGTLTADPAFQRSVIKRMQERPDWIKGMNPIHSMPWTFQWVGGRSIKRHHAKLIGITP